MGKIKDLERILLEKLRIELETSGYLAELVEESGRETVLLITINGLGDREDTLQTEVSFLPGTEEEIKELGFNVLQMFSCMKEDIRTETCNELARAVLRLNPKIPGGAFGIDERHRLLYYKSSCIITDNMDERIAHTLIEVQLGIFLNTLDRYNDVLMDIMEGNRTADDAIDKGLV